MDQGRSKVFLADASDRSQGIKRLFGKFDLRTDGAVALKANYNSGDPFPATTHIETLRTIVDLLKAEASAQVIMAERSGMGYTPLVLGNRGVIDLSKSLGFDLIDLDALDLEGWDDIQAEDLHWQQGFKIARIFREADKIVQTCCLKTHRFGGHFTMSLKNSVGIVAARPPGTSYDYMRELHTSQYQRLMIAEINKFYKMDMVLMDGTLGFSSGGPERGTLIKPGVLLASADRVALDAAGVALLRYYGTTPEVSRGRIFDQEQIARAASLGVGVASADKIDIEPLDQGSWKAAEIIESFLDRQG
ncbi:MAG: DUF362 domain-containing protein [Methanotrichaceae archaeon]